MEIEIRFQKSICHHLNSRKSPFCGLKDEKQLVNTVLANQFVVKINYFKTEYCRLIVKFYHQVRASDMKSYCCFYIVDGVLHPDRGSECHNDTKRNFIKIARSVSKF